MDYSILVHDSELDQNLFKEIAKTIAVNAKGMMTPGGGLQCCCTNLDRTRADGGPQTITKKHTDFRTNTC